jgi:hypothetical protein
MNKLVEKSATTTPAALAEYQAELDRFRQAAIQNSKPLLMGHLLRFRKAEWLAGPDKEKIAAGTHFVGIMNEARHGWIRWGEDKNPVHVVGKVVEGFQAPEREQLDCRDQTTWPIGLSGKQEDPWKKVAYLPLTSLDGEQLLTFKTDTKTGVPAFWKLIDRYQWLGRKHPGQYPIIEIQSTGYDDKRYGWVDTPAFKIVGWTGRPDLQQLIGSDGDSGDDGSAAAETLKDEMEDEIPF